MTYLHGLGKRKGVNTLKKYLIALIFVIVLSACGKKEIQPDVFLTPPSISVDMSRENCPSIEAEVGMTVAWKNVDTVSQPIKVERLNADGSVADTGRSTIDPGTIFALQFYEAGIYHVYCTENANTYATITVK